MDGSARHLRISLDNDPELMCRLLRCERLAQYDIWDQPDDTRWTIICDADSDKHLSDRPQISLVPGPVYRECVIWSCRDCPPGNAEGRWWIHGYALVVLTRDGVIESLPEDVWAKSFGEVVHFFWTDWRAAGIEEDIPALIRVFELEPELQGRVSICGPRGAIRVPGGMPPLLP
jgi:hypothetical protein